MMKFLKRKRISLLLLTAWILLLCLPVSAVQSGERLCDGADLLYASEEQQLSARLDDISERLRLDVVVVTVDSTGGRSARAFADDYFDYGGFGYGADRDGVLLLICMDTRDWWISTSGYGITAFTDAGLDYIGERIVPDLSAGYYADAFTAFAELCEIFVTEARAGNPYDRHTLPGDQPSMGTVLGISLLIGVVAAFIYTGILRGELHSVQKKTAASEYVREGSLRMHQAKDLFLYRNVRRIPRQTSSGGGGGSSVHRSSSGRSHGGGGGRF